MSLQKTQEQILNYFFARESVDQKVLSLEVQDELAIYKSLIITSLEELLEKIYPFCTKVIREQFREIVLDYFQQCPCKSAIYIELAKDFASFLASEFFRNKYHYPSYLAQLAEYEWIEVELFNKEDASSTKSLQLNPISQLKSFQYPITAIINFIKETEDQQELASTDVEPEEEAIFIYRDPESLLIRFFQLPVSAYFIIERLKQNQDLEKIFQDYCRSFSISTDDTTKTAYLQMIENLKKNKILVIS